MVFTSEPQNETSWVVHSNTSNMNIDTICKYIDMGDKEEGGIRLKPFYQRDYKFTRKDESLLIESLLIGIPIPTIYLASDTSKVPHISNVIDGHHRLRAIHRFIKNEFALTGLNRLDNLNGKYFKNFEQEIANKLLYQVSLNLQFIHVQNNPDLEVEIFTRYNKGTNPLTSQEIRHVIYNSPFKDWVLELVDKLQKDDKFKTVYNITDKRYSDKNIHENLFVLFSIFNDDLDERCTTSTKYTEKIMKMAYEMPPSEMTNLINKCDYLINSLNLFLDKAYIDDGLENPFSKSVYGVKGHHKFQVSIMMCMVSCIKYLIESKKVKLDFNDDVLMEKIKKSIKDGFINSGFHKVTSSTTKPSLLIDTSSEIKKVIDKELNNYL